MKKTKPKRTEKPVSPSGYRKWKKQVDDEIELAFAKLSKLEIIDQRIAAAERELGELTKSLVAAQVILGNLAKRSTLLESDDALMALRPYLKDFLRNR